MPYDKDQLRKFYDEYGEKEWRRLEASLSAQVNFHLHQHYLLEYIKRGDRVLEAGAGPGRFTLELAWAGAHITVLDISPEQLRQNRRHVAAEGVQSAVMEWVEGDILDLTRFPAGAFDAVVCYGGPLSYVFDQAGMAVDQMLRVLQPGGILLLSVMSLLGTTRHFLHSVVEAAFHYGLDKVAAITLSGDLIGEIAKKHHCHMYRWSELEQLLLEHGCGIVAASASGFLSLADEETLRVAHSRLDLWESLLAWERSYCREPGALDGGTHIIAVARKNSNGSL